jgi:hypothetical protein
MPLRTRVARLAASVAIGNHRFDRDHEPLDGGRISCLKIGATGIARVSHISASGITLSDVMYMAP